jgi:hypothetical protein
MSASDRCALLLSPSSWVRARASHPAAIVLAVLPWLVACRGHEATGPTPEALAATPTAPAKVEPEKVEPEKVEPEKAEPEKVQPGSLAPLTEAQLAIFHGSVEDETPEWRGGITEELANLHYLSGNEKSLDAFHATLTARQGGGYVGVGTDQAYIFTGWGRFELAWLTDYDPAVKEVHELYRLFILASPTPAEFIALWDKESREQAHAVIAAGVTHHERAAQLRAWYRSASPRIRTRFAVVNRRMAKAGVRTFLEDQAQYDYVRTMLEQRRMRPMVVDLHADQGVSALAEASRQLGVPIRVLYLSNAEQYWKRYPKQYRANVAAISFADDGVVLRTILSPRINDDYRYNVQAGASYQEWLARPFVSNVYQVLHKGPKASPEGITFFETTDSPDDSPMGRRWHQRHGTTATKAGEASAPKDPG